MKIIFMGTPAFAGNILEMLIKEHEVLMVVTQPDKPVGRKKEIELSCVKKIALNHHIPVIQPIKLKENYQQLIDLNADLIITAAYGQMVPKVLLDHYKAINVHGSLLPKYRGGAPIQYALFDGLKETGITIMFMKLKMDSGPIIMQSSIAITEEDNYESLTLKLADLGAVLLKEVLSNYPNVSTIDQDESQVTFAYTLKREDEQISFDAHAIDVFHRIQGLTPKPGAYFTHKGTEIKVFKAKVYETELIQPGTVLQQKKRLIIGCKTQAIELLEIQVQGKKKMAVKDFLNGQNLFLIEETIK